MHIHDPFILSEKIQHIFSIHRGTFLESLATSHAVVLEKSPGRISWISNRSPKKKRRGKRKETIILQDSKGTFMVTLVIMHVDVLTRK